jgi:glycosyltransferase involved in cell wall biosynthesis
MSALPTPPHLRVAHITTIDLSLRVLLLRQLQALRDAGFDVSGISSAGSDVPALEAGGIRHIAVRMSRRYTPLADLRSLFELWRVLRREKFDVVHTHTAKAGLLGQYAALLAGVPLRVHTIHGLYLPQNASPRMRRAFVLLERVTMRFSHYNFAVSAEDVPVAVAEKISKAARIELSGNGINLAAFSAERQTPEKRAATRRSLGLTDEHLVVGMVARLVAEKGYLEMFEAAALILKEEPRARFIFVGGAEPEKSDAIGPETAAEWKIDGVSQFLGYRTDMPDLYAIMDVHVLPSHREGFPIAPMEASAMGVASVVTDVRGCRQAVDDGVTGLIVPVRAPRALAAAIVTLLRDPEKRSRMGRAAREKAEREFDEQVVFAKVLAAYDRLLHRGNHGAITASD